MLRAGSGKIPEIFRRIQTAVLLNLFGITDGQWTSKAGVTDAEANADASFMLAENNGCVDPPCRQVLYAVEYYYQ